MVIYECIKPVSYGRIDYSPDAKDEKNRIIRLPVDIPPDETISKHFKVISGAQAVMPEPEDKTISKKNIGIGVPDLLTKIQEEQKAAEVELGEDVGAVEDEITETPEPEPKPKIKRRKRRTKRGGKKNEE